MCVTDHPLSPQGACHTLGFGLAGFGEYVQFGLRFAWLGLEQGLAILELESRDRDQCKLIVSLVVETETETLLSSVSISRPRLRLFLFQSRY